MKKKKMDAELNKAVTDATPPTPDTASQNQITIDELLHMIDSDAQFMARMFASIIQRRRINAVVGYLATSILLKALLEDLKRFAMLEPMHPNDKAAEDVIAKDMAGLNLAIGAYLDMRTRWMKQNGR